jgi:integrase
MDRLTPEQIEAMYAALSSAGLAPATVHQVHRTLRTALGEAFARNQIVHNPAVRARSPRLIEKEIEPLSLEEAQSILVQASHVRNGVRYVVALALGLRQGEALGLAWEDIDLDGVPPTLSVRRALQRQAWQHGCEGGCGARRAADCPERHSGGLVLVPPKSNAGRRTVALPTELVESLRVHLLAQEAERHLAGDGWIGRGFVFCQSDGSPIDPRADWRDWKRLLARSGVRDARLHDARHTAATMLLVQGVDARTVMDLLGWSHIAMTRRYQHVVGDLRVEAARRIGDLLWGDT